MPKKPVRRPTKAKNAVFVYVSKCCNEIADKAPLAMPEATGIGRFGDSPKDRNEQGLGGWRCGKCKKPCSVNRHKPQKESAAA